MPFFIFALFLHSGPLPLRTAAGMQALPTALWWILEPSAEPAVLVCMLGSLLETPQLCL